MMSWASNKINHVQNGEFDRSHFPEEMKGEVAKDLWNDANFAYGMEYGYLLAMLDVIKEEEALIECRSHP